MKAWAARWAASGLETWAKMPKVTDLLQKLKKREVG
jgi:hypothetical protein